MLSALYITKSRIRQDLLALFFTNPSKRYYLRELERELGFSAGNIRRELLKFQTDALFNTSRSGNLLYYSINRKHPFYQEMRNIVTKTVGVEGSLRKILKKMPGIDIAFVYGSFASKQKAESDVDLMIIGKVDIMELHEKLRVLERRIKREINPTIYSREEFINKAKEKRAFITDLLEKPKIMIQGKEIELQKIKRPPC